MLVMLLGQTRVLYSMANDGLLPKKFFADDSSQASARHGRTRFWLGLLAAIVGSVTPIDDIGKMVNIGTLLAFVIVCIAVMVLRRTNPRSAAAVPHAMGAVRPHHGHPVQRLHDVQAGMGQLGAVDYLAGDRHGRLLHLQPETQQGAGSGKRAEARSSSISLSLCSVRTAEGGCPYVIQPSLSQIREGPFCFTVEREGSQRPTTMRTTDL